MWCLFFLSLSYYEFFFLLSYYDVLFVLFYFKYGILIWNIRTGMGCSYPDPRFTKTGSTTGGPGPRRTLLWRFICIQTIYINKTYSIRQG